MPYPSNDLQAAEAILGLLGSFWVSPWVDSAYFRQFAGSFGRQYEQSFADLNETLACRSRFTTPVYHREEWQSLSILQSARGVYTPAYGDGVSVFGGPPQLAYGAQGVRQAAAWPLPEALTGVSVVCDALTAPQAILVAGMDFLLDLKLGFVVFATDPFQQTFTRTPIFTNGVQTDTAAALLCFDTAYDREQVWGQYGYLAGIKLPSSQQYRDLVNAVFDGAQQGYSLRALRAFFSALLDFPLAGSAGEVVAAVTADADGPVVITDKAAYRYGRGATPTVTAGAVVNTGDALATGLEFFDLSLGVVPDGLRALAVGPGLLLGDYQSELTFAAGAVPLEVSTVGGKTYVAFALGGLPDDVTQFWDSVHVAGLAAGQTLANLLDQRTNQVGEPQASNLPATVDPLQFLVSNVLRHNTVLVRLALGAAGPHSLGLGPVWLLRQLVPPQTLLLMLVELPTSSDSGILSSAAAGLDAFDGAEPFAETTGVPPAGVMTAKLVMT